MKIPVKDQPNIKLGVAAYLAQRWKKETWTQKSSPGALFYCCHQPTEQCSCANVNHRQIDKKENKTKYKTFQIIIRELMSNKHNKNNQH